jgi:nicotinate dehydrogenase subunit A
MTGSIALKVNGSRVETQARGDATLLDLLRGELGLCGARFGCGEGLCGACHVLVDDRAVTACNTPVWAVEGKSIVTPEGLGTAAAPHPLQTAFIAEQAMQCGYCVSGILISAAALLKRNPDPTDAEIRQALERNLCRCGAHNRMVRAVRRAANALGGA